jgi:DNA repair photolyase
VLDVRRPGVEFVEHRAKSIINTPESTGMGFWSINPYVGCEFGCTYCYARFAHHYVTERGSVGPTAQAADQREPFERRIFVKRHKDVLAALERDLHRVRRRSQSGVEQHLVIGTATDPYQPAERRYRLTQAVLQRLLAERALHIGLITKSPFILRDVDLLEDLARVHRVSIYISLISIDVRLIKLFEARSPMPHARLRALAKLTRANLRAGLIVAPILPGITDSVPQVTALMAAASDAGAKFVYPSVLRMYPDARERLLPRIERHLPAIAHRYAAAYRTRPDPPQAYIMAVGRRFRRIAARFGIMETDGDREQPRMEVGTSLGQLNLFA